MEIIKQIDSEILILDNLKYLLGKKVKINIEVVDDSKPAEEKPLGKYKLGKDLDGINVRHFAYEEN